MDALVMSGGGSRGSWEAGALLYLAEVRTRGFEFVSGTSVGSVNAAGIAMFPPEKFKEAVAFTVDLWKKRVTKSSDIWSLRFPLGIPGLWNESVGKADALDGLLRDVVDVEKIRTSGVTLRMPAVDVLTGKLVEYDETSPDIVKAIMASASFPGVFPAIEDGDMWMTDGGLIDIAPLGAAIRAGASRATVLVTRDPNMVRTVTKEEMGAVHKFGYRVIDIMSTAILQGDLNTCGLVNELVDAGKRPGKRKFPFDVISPSVPLGNSLDFSGDLMKRQIDQGYADAKADWEG